MGIRSASCFNECTKRLSATARLTAIDAATFGMPENLCGIGRIRPIRPIRVFRPAVAGGPLTPNLVVRPRPSTLVPRVIRDVPP